MTGQTASLPPTGVRIQPYPRARRTRWRTARGRDRASKGRRAGHRWCEGTSAGHVVEVAVLDAAEEGLDLRPCVDEGGTPGVAGVAHREAAARQRGQLHAVAAGVAAAAL